MLSDQDKRDLEWYYFHGVWQPEDLYATVSRIIEEHGGYRHRGELVRRGECTCGEVDKENRLGHQDDCRYFSGSLYSKD